MTLEQLEKKLKQHKLAIALLVGALSFLILVNIFLAFRKGFSAISVVPVTLVPIFILCLNSVKELKEEINLRNKENQLF